MAKLINIICLGLLYVALVSGMSLRGQGSSSEEVQPITKGEFEKKLEEFSNIFKDASTAVGELEATIIKARAEPTAENWYAVYFKFLEVIEGDITKLDPAFEHLGHMMERIAESPDEFPPLPYCDSSARLASGKTTITTSFEDARALAFQEDVGCFKNKILKISVVNLAAVKQPNYSEHDAFQQYMTLVEEGLQIEKALERFIEALVQLDEQSNSGGNSKRGQDGNADIAKLVRLLKQLNLGDRR